MRVTVELDAEEAAALQAILERRVRICERRSRGAESLRMFSAAIRWSRDAGIAERIRLRLATSRLVADIDRVIERAVDHAREQRS